MKTCCVACLSVAAGVAFADDPVAAWGVQDSFEGDALGSHWSGDAAIQAKDSQYPKSAPAFGYPIPSAAHAKVLKVEGKAVCTNTSAATAIKASQVDFMVKVVAPDEAPDVATETAGAQIALAAWTNEVSALETTVPLKLFCTPRTGATPTWVTLTNSVLTGTWVRVAMNFDYTQKVCRVSLNGSPLVTAEGFRTNLKNTNDADGSWYQLASNPAAGDRVSEVKVIGTTQLDDLVITNAALEAFNPYVDANGKDVTATINGVDVPLNVIDKSGLSAAEVAAGGAAPGDTLSVLAVVEAGLELGQGQTFEMKTMAAELPVTAGEDVTQNFTITFPGTNPETYYTISAYDNEAGTGDNLVTGTPTITPAGNGKTWTGTVNVKGKKTIYFKLKAQQPAK